MKKRPMSGTLLESQVSSSTCSLVVCSSDIDRFFSDGALEGVREAGATDRLSRGSVDIALIKVSIYEIIRFIILKIFLEGTV